MLIPFSLVPSSVKCGKLKKKCEAFIIIMDNSYSFIHSFIQQSFVLFFCVDYMPDTVLRA